MAVGGAAGAWPWSCVRAAREGRPILQESVFPNRILRAKSHPYLPRGHVSDGARRIRPESARVEIVLAAARWPRFGEALRRAALRRWRSGRRLGLPRGGSPSSGNCIQPQKALWHFPSAFTVKSISTKGSRSLRTLRIFVVDAHADTLAGYSLYLASLGHTMIGAASMKEALAALPGARCNVLISELRLPDGDGCELLAHLPSSKPIYAVAITSLGMASDRAKSRKAGFRHHLLKPFQVGELEAVLDEASHELD